MKNNYLSFNNPFYVVQENRDNSISDQWIFRYRGTFMASGRMSEVIGLAEDHNRDRIERLNALPTCSDVIARKGLKVPKGKPRISRADSRCYPAMFWMSPTPNRILKQERTWNEDGQYSSPETTALYVAEFCKINSLTV